MIEIKDVDRKEKISKEIKDLIGQLNGLIALANNVSLSVRIDQNRGLAPKNSDISCFISETVSY